MTSSTIIIKMDEKIKYLYTISDGYFEMCGRLLLENKDLIKDNFNKKDFLKIINEVLIKREKLDFYFFDEYIEEEIEHLLTDEKKYIMDFSKDQKIMYVKGTTYKLKIDLNYLNNNTCFKVRDLILLEEILRMDLFSKKVKDKIIDFEIPESSFVSIDSSKIKDNILLDVGNDKNIKNRLEDFFNGYFLRIDKLKNLEQYKKEIIKYVLKNELKRDELKVEKKSFIKIVKSIDSYEELKKFLSLKNDIIIKEYLKKIENKFLNQK